MSKPNTEFNLGLRDIDLIEDALNLVLGFDMLSAPRTIKAI